MFVCVLLLLGIAVQGMDKMGKMEIVRTVSKEQELYNKANDCVFFGVTEDEMCVWCLTMYKKLGLSTAYHGKSMGFTDTKNDFWQCSLFCAHCVYSIEFPQMQSLLKIENGAQCQFCDGEVFNYCLKCRYRGVHYLGDVEDIHKKYIELESEKKKCDAKRIISVPILDEDEVKSLLPNQSRRAVDPSTIHIVITRSVLGILQCVWITNMPHADLKNTLDMMGYINLQLARTTLLYSAFAGWCYVASKEYYCNERATCSNWKTVHRDDKKRIVANYGLTTFNILFMLLAYHYDVGGGHSGEGGLLTTSTSYFGMTVGLLTLINALFQNRIPALNVNRKFADFIKQQPQKYLRRAPVAYENLRGHITGIFATFLPLFSFFQGAFVLYRVKTEPGIYGEDEIDKYIYLAIAGIFLGTLGNVFFQWRRWKNYLGVLTFEQLLIAILAWFASNHSDPLTSELAILAQLVFGLAYLLVKFLTC